MKTGRNIEELGKELLRQREIRKDYVADTAPFSNYKTQNKLKKTNKSYKYSIGYAAGKRHKFFSKSLGDFQPIPLCGRTAL